LTFSVVGVVVDTLDIGCLANVKWKGLGEGCAVRRGAVETGALVRQGVLVA